MKVSEKTKIKIRKILLWDLESVEEKKLSIFIFLFFVFFCLSSKANVVPVNANIELEYLIGRDSVLIYNNSEQIVDESQIELKLYNEKNEIYIVQKKAYDIIPHSSSLVSVKNDIPENFNVSSFDLEIKGNGIYKYSTLYMVLLFIMGGLIILTSISFFIKFYMKSENNKRFKANLKGTEEILPKLKLK